METGWQDNPAWDDAIEQSADIVVAGRQTPERRSRPSTSVLHRADDLLVDEAELRRPEIGGRLEEMLGSANARYRKDDAADAAESVGLRLLRVAGDRRDGDLLELVRQLNEIAPRSAGVNHVLVAGPQRHGGDSPPQAAVRPLDIPGTSSAGEGKTIAVLDTGIADPEPFAVRAETTDVEPLIELPPGQLGPAVGHGTFVAGIVSRVAPGAKILVRRVLSGPLGEADELQIITALGKLPEVDVVNLSFGGFAVDDATMLAFERAVNALPRSTLVVAAAGNHGVVRPFFPAAFKRVLAVGAAELDEEKAWRAAEYTNFGPWVDLCAVGTDIDSTFVTFPPDGSGFDGGATWSGTSFAAPHVSAVAAALAARDGISPRLAAHQLVHSTQPLVAEVGRLVP
ncbi:MAG: S8/S53 family peptidase [Actinomycetota bacterium]|nr:S8/S53 family peptidase [Actinomycetota bacterium]